ncbi:MAG TPA: PAS domain S-box protein [Planctomycetes bacterium]|nr:PAS domain S-box protein [Planctomycetota bacterium]
MRINEPNTGREVPFGKKEILLSTTDPGGVITYANQDFARVAGYSLEELVGQPHNLVRHKDMPPLAFKDLWGTIQGGRSWLGVVKNHCKNGDHYWVDAYVTPIQKNGKIIEYQSVRVLPSRDRVERADALYKKLREAPKGKLPKEILPPKLNLLQKSLLVAVFSLLVAVLPAFVLGAGAAWYWFAASFVAGGLVGMVGLRTVLHPVMEVARRAKETYDNPLAHYIYAGRTDEAGALRFLLHYRKMEAVGILGRLRESAEGLVESATGLKESAQATSEKLHEQRNQTELVAAAMEEMSASATEVANHTENATEHAKDSALQVSEALPVVEGAESSMTSLSSSVQNAAEEIETLVKENDRIRKVLGIITDIAEQTNLLALNATIEAARAGEQGRGFAVVADEVRALAQRTEKATGEIEEVIQKLRARADEAREIMVRGRSLSEKTAQDVQMGAEALRQIGSGIQSIQQMSEGIYLGANEQKKVSMEMVEKVVNISRSGADINELAEKNAEEGDRLLQISKGLKDLVIQFRG